MRNYMLIGANIEQREFRSIGQVWLCHRDDGQGRLFTLDEVVALKDRLQPEFEGKVVYTIHAVPAQ